MVSNPTQPVGVCYALVGRDLLLPKNGGNLCFSDLEMLKSADEKADFFAEPEVGYCAISLSDYQADGFERVSLRRYFYENGEEEVYRLSRARAVASWRANFNYCNCCGTKLVDSESLTARICPSCGKNHFPRIDPCIIVLVHRGDTMLLARHVQRNQDVYACIAGFMEAGETAEHTVAREVFEETGIRVKNVIYRGSQSWPFPNQLMLGFTAEYESGELALQEDEIADAGWFSADDCPATPTPGSIAYRLIHKMY